MMLSSPLSAENLHPKVDRFFPRSGSGCSSASNCDIEREPALSAGNLPAKGVLVRQLFQGSRSEESAGTIQGLCGVYSW
jgi:hypothetical protein